MSTAINPIYWERTGQEPVRIIDIRTLPEDVKTAIILAAADVERNIQTGQLSGLPANSAAYESLSGLADVIENMRTFMHDIPGLVPVAGDEQDD